MSVGPPPPGGFFGLLITLVLAAAGIGLTYWILSLLVPHPWPLVVVGVLVLILLAYLAQRSGYL